MRLWHQDMIPHLDRQRLLGQHRECAALRGNGWGRKHSTVDYVFTYPHEYLYSYHLLIMLEMEKRGYNVTSAWFNAKYRGKNCEPWESVDSDLFNESFLSGKIYPEHDEKYLTECLENLKEKGLNLSEFFEPQI